MRLGGLRTTPEPHHEPTTIAAALRSATSALGQRPAITVLRAQRRDEQGFTSLLRWTAKGAHLLTDEWGVGVDDIVRIAAPPDWTTATVCYAAWWLGATIDPGTADGDVAVTIVHEGDAQAVSGGADLIVGDAADGGPTGPDTAEAWTSSAQIHPDDPPTPPTDAGTDAVRLPDGRTFTQRELLEAALRWGTEGAIGLPRDSDPDDWLPALARPLVTGLPTVVVAGADEAAVARENVRTWVGA